MMRRLMASSRRHSYKGMVAAVAVGLISVNAIHVGQSTHSAKSSSGSSVTIGAVWPLTGADASSGATYMLGMKAAIKYIDTHGGVLGHPLKVAVRDSESTSVGAAAATKALIGDKVAAIVGDDTSDDLAMAPVVQQAHIPLFTAASDNAVFDLSLYTWVFATGPTVTQRAAAQVAYLVNDLHLKKIGVLYVDNSFGIEGTQYTTSSLKKYGLTPVSTVSFPSTATDVSSEETSLRSANPDAIVLWTYGPGLVAAVQGLYTLGWNIPFIALPPLHASVQGIPASVLAHAYGGPIANSFLIPTFHSAPSEQADMFLKIYKQQNSSALSSKTFTPDIVDSGTAFDDVLLAAEAINAAHSTNSQRIKVALQSGHKFVLSGATKSYSATNHVGPDTGYSGIYGFQNGLSCNINGCVAAPGQS